MSFSTSVVRGDRTYIFFNGKTESGDPTIRYYRLDLVNDDNSVRSLKVSGNNIPPSDGPVASCIVDNGVDGIRLYVINKGTIVEYGLDSPKGGNDVWVRQGFTQDIKLDSSSFLDAHGAGELGKGGDVMLRLYYAAAGAANIVTQSTFLRSKGWQPPQKIVT